MATPQPSPQARRFEERLRIFRDRLLQVDFRNRSILVRKVPRRWLFDLAALSPMAARDVLNRVLQGEGQVCLVRDNDDSPEAEEARQSLTQVERSSRLLFDETGLQDFSVGFPFLSGHLGERYIRGPLVLFPVRLEHQRRDRNPGWYVVVSPDSLAVMNRALVAAVRKVRGVGLPETFQETLERILEDMGLHPVESRPELFLAALDRALREAGFPLEGIPFPAAATVDLLPIPPYTAEQIAALTPQRLHWEMGALLGTLPQGSTAIHQDYESLLAAIAAGEHDQGILDDLLEAPASAMRPPPPEVSLDAIPDREQNFALPSDGTQDQVIAEAQQAECVVVRGPPGTGKSQLIVNLVTNALAKQQRVLVVCQKRAALDVVFQRLDRAGLSDSVVLLHDARADRSEVYARLLRHAKTPAPAEDVRLDQALTQATQSIDQVILEANRLVKPLWEVQFGGIRLQELYLGAEPGYHPRLDLRALAPILTWPALEGLLPKLPDLEVGHRRFDGSQAPLAGRRSFARLPVTAREELDGVLAAVESAAVSSAICLGGSEEQERVLRHAQHVESRKGSAIRFLDPWWWSARGDVERLWKARGTDPRLADISPLVTSLRLGRELLRRLEPLSRWIQPIAWPAMQGLRSKPQALLDLAVKMRRALQEFDAIQEHDKRLAALSGSEAPLYRLAANVLGARESMSRLVRQEVFAAWIAEVERTRPELSGDPFNRYLSLRRRLKELIEQRRTLFVRHLLKELAARARTPLFPPGQHHPNKLAKTDWNALLYELGKQRRVKPVRRLLEEYPFQFLRMASCWLASPEAVSEVFPLTRGMFDLVIFDEASQLAVERALPASYRGRRVVIAGDEKQLRPFDLFQLQEDEEEAVNDDVVEAESLLLLAMRTFDTRNLSWHYRSRYQELIDFSNRAFYDGSLQIAANVQRTFSTAPIEFARCDGIWEERTNPREAQKVVDFIAAILHDGEPSGRAPSIGVITFNEPQRDCVLDAIDARRETDADFDRMFTAADAETRPLDERPFVKNIENVQGDERDVILFSVGYAPDSAGKLRVQFGSLNVLGGENRLNVAVTRARQRVILVASFDPEQLAVEGTKNPGPKRLKEYLRYAAAVSSLRREDVHALLEDVNPQVSLVRPQPSGDGDALEDQVADALRGEGYQIDRSVGFSGYRLDLAVVHPLDQARYVLGIECDGSTFHSAKSARERDVTRQRFLEDRGWAVERVWSRNWWRNRPAEVDRLRRRIEGLSGPPPT